MKSYLEKDIIKIHQNNLEIGIKLFIALGS